ncbi:MAG: DUF502 domain-containing protein [Thermosynechococcaceae cyanobacterium]
MDRRLKVLLGRLKQDLKTDLIAGLLVVIPLATTIWLSVTSSVWVIRFLTTIPKRLNPFPDINPLLLDLINLSVGLVVPLLSILLIGLMARNFAGRWLLDWAERTLLVIPLVGNVYKTLKQILETLLKDSRSKFRRVVLVEYPRRGLWAIAFVTGTIETEIAPGLPAPMVNLFIPTAPNPTTGWYSLVPESEVIDLNIAVEDAFKLVISGGIVAPDWSTVVPKPKAFDTNSEAEAALAVSR